MIAPLLHSLRNRLIAAFVGLAVVPIVIAGALLGWHIYYQHLDDSLARQQLLAQHVAGQLEAFVRRYELQLDDTVKLTGFSELDDPARQRVLALLLARQSALREVWYLDAEGRERLRLSRVRLNTDPSDAGGGGEIFRAAMARRDIHFGRIYYAADSGEPLMDIGLPVLDAPSGRITGVLAAQIRVKTIWTLIAELPSRPGEAVYVLDGQQRVIAHRNPSLVLRETRAALLSGVSRQSGLGGADVFIAATTTHNGGQEWTVVVEKSAIEVLAPALGGVKIVAVVTLLALLVALLLCFYAIRRIVTPIQEVAGVARTIRDGDLTCRVVTTGNDEIGEMGHAFNDMTARLRNTLESLEHEVGERRRAEDTLRHERDFIQTVVEGANTLLVVLDRQGRIIRFNRAAEELTGYAFADVAGSPFWEFFLPSEERPAMMAMFNNIETGNLIRRHEHPWLMRDGSLRMFDWSNAVTFDAHAKVEFVISIGVDITERRHAEHLLAENRKVLRTMIDSASMWISYFGQDGRYVVANQRYAETFGLPLDKIEGAHYTEVLPPALAQAHRPYIERCLAGETVSFNEASDVGAAEPLYTTGVYVPVLDEGGRIIGGVVAISDVSQIKLVEHSLRELNASLEQRVQEQTEENLLKERLLLQQSRHAAMGEMVSAIAHQWRQPLNALAITLANLQDSFEFGELDKACMESTMETAHGFIQKMSSTIDDFRNFFRAKQRKEQYSLADAIRDAANLVQPSLAASAVELALECPTDMENFGSANELGQVLVNLIVNAKEASIEHKVAAPRVIVKLERDGDNAVISIEDNAGGIAAGVGERIFDPYFTTKPMGTGIGLYMARIIIERHLNGSIAYANIGHGARFTLTFPLCQPTPEELREL